MPNKGDAESEYRQRHQLSHRGAAAGDLGLDIARLTADMEKPEIKDIIDRSYRLADKRNIQGTPAFVIGNELVPGAASFEDLTAAFKRARGGGTAVTARCQPRL